jgi:hypothetical protein
MVLVIWYGLPCPLVVAEILTGLVVVATGVFMIALPNLIGHITEVLLRIDIAHETLHSAAVWALKLLLAVLRQLWRF